MKIDMNQVLKGLDGETLKRQDNDLTLKMVCVDAIMADFPDEMGKVEGSEKMRRFKFAERIFQANDPVDLEVEDISFIKVRINKGFGTLVTAQAFKLLDNYV